MITSKGKPRGAGGRKERGDRKKKKKKGAAHTRTSRHVKKGGQKKKTSTAQNRVGDWLSSRRGGQQGDTQRKIKGGTREPRAGKGEAVKTLLASRPKC